MSMLSTAAFLLELWASTGMKANSRPTRQSCSMRVPMVICPWAMLVERLSSRHLTTMEVDDMDTCMAGAGQDATACKGCKGCKSPKVGLTYSVCECVDMRAMMWECVIRCGNV